MDVGRMACGYGCPLGGIDGRKSHVLCPERRKRIAVGIPVFESAGYIGELSKGCIKTWKTHLDVIAVVQLTVTTTFYVKSYFALLVPTVCGVRQRLFPTLLIEEDDVIKRVSAKPVQRRSVSTRTSRHPFKMTGSSFLGVPAAAWSAIAAGSCAHKRFVGTAWNKDTPLDIAVPHHIAQHVPQKPPQHTVGDYEEIVCSYCKSIYGTLDEYIAGCVPDFQPQQHVT
jgi:hypothetical protein